MPKFILDLKIPPEEYQKTYLGVRQVTAVARDGRRVQFPAKILQPFVTHEGIEGTFVIEVDDKHRFIEIRRLNSSVE